MLEKYIFCWLLYEMLSVMMILKTISIRYSIINVLGSIVQPGKCESSTHVMLYTRPTSKLVMDHSKWCQEKRKTN